MKRGLVIGKFYPPHSGHKHLIDQAQLGCDELDVLICDNEKYGIPAEQRREWLQKIHPTAKVQIIPDIDNDDDSELWAAYTSDFLGYTPDVVFSSEDYGIQYAYCMDAEHHMVDRQRVTVPISGTKVRANPLGEWQYVEHPVRCDIALRIVVVGAESTGTTTLSQALAKHFAVPWVPEYGRLYSEALLHSGADWNDADFVHIATTQQQMERKLAAKSNGLIICDTNATATQLWQDRYLGHISDDVRTIAQKDRADFYILTGDEIPFVQDGLRDGEHIRHDMHKAFVQYLEDNNLPHVILRGSRKTRLNKAISLVQTITEGYTIP